MVASDRIAPSKLAGWSAPHLTYGSFGPMSPHANCHLDPLSRFYKAHGRNQHRPTNRHTTLYKCGVIITLIVATLRRCFWPKKYTIAAYLVLSLCQCYSLWKASGIVKSKATQTAFCLLGSPLQMHSLNWLKRSLLFATLKVRRSQASR